MSERVQDLIQAAEREIRRDSEDLARLKQRYPGFDFVRVEDVQNKADQTSAQQPSYLQTAIEGLISTSVQEWTSRAVFSELTSRGMVSFNNQEAGMNAVALSLTALKDAGKIQRVHEGRGRDPHRYKAIEKEASSEEKTS